MIFDSTAPAGQGEAVYITATATAVPDDDLDAVCPQAFRTTAGARWFIPDDLRGGALQLYVARTRSCEVHVAAHHPAHGHGVDTRQQADPPRPDKIAGSPSPGFSRGFGGERRA